MNYIKAFGMIIFVIFVLAAHLSSMHRWPKTTTTILGIIVIASLVKVIGDNL